MNDLPNDDGIKFAMKMLDQIPKDKPEALEGYLTGVLVVFWGALWGTLGTKYAKGFIEAQLRGMDYPHETFTKPRDH